MKRAFHFLWPFAAAAALGLAIGMAIVVLVG